MNFLEMGLGPGILQMNFLEMGLGPGILQMG